MNIKTEINEQQIDESVVQPLSSLIKTGGWLLALLFLSQLVLGFFASGYYSLLQLGDSSSEAFNMWFMSIPVLLSLSLISPIITIPLLIKASGEKGKVKSWQNGLVFIAIKQVERQKLAKWVGIAAVFWLVSSLLGELLNLPIEQFMLDVKAANNSFSMLLFILITICVVVPIMEELTFRGWLYSKIKQTRLGDTGALILTSIVFTAIHTQYNNIVTLLFIFSLGLLLGYVRFKAANTSYAIVIHILYNSLAMFTLLAFDF